MVSNRGTRATVRLIPWMRERCCGLLLLWAALLLFALPASAAEPTITLEVNRTRVPSGGVLLLTVTLEGFSGGAGDPVFPQTEGFDIYDAGHSTNISLVNGHLSKTTSFSYQLSARGPGVYAFGPITIEDRGRSHRSEVLSLEVTDPGTPASSRGGASPTDSGPDDISGDEQDRGLFIRVEVDQPEVYQDQQLTLRFKLYQRVGVRVMDISEFQPPSTEGFWREDLGPQQDYTEIVDGERYQVREITWALFPTTSGELLIGEASVVCHLPARSRRRGRFGDFFSGSLFDTQPVRLASAGVRIRSLPLPSEGRPEAFSGSVGDYRLTAAFDSAEGRQGEPLTLTLTIAGRGHIQTIGEPRWPAWDDFRVFDSGDAVSVQKRSGVVAGEKTFTQVLIPNRSGDLKIPSIPFVFFDPVQGRYRTVETGALGIQVLPPNTVGAGSGRHDVVALGEDILYIRTGVGADLRRPAGSPFTGRVWVHLIPLGAIAVGAYFRRRRQALDDDPAYARRSKALRLAQKRLDATRGEGAGAVAELAETIQEYLSDWLDLEVRGLRGGELEERLGDAGVGDEHLGRLLGILSWADDVRFASGDPNQIRAQRTEATEILPRIEKDLRDRPRRAGRGALLISLLLLASASGWCGPANASSSVSHSAVKAVHDAEIAFEEGDYDASLELYQRILAGGWSSSAIYYNLGCAAHRAGRAGWAVAYLEEARRLAPRDPDVRHNLRIIRGRLQDRLPEEEPSWVLGAMTGLLDSYSPADLIRVALALFWFLAVVLCLHWLGRPPWRSGTRRLLAAIGIAAVVLAAALGLKLFQIHSAPSGVVVVDEVAVLSGPREGETVQFMLHAGSMLHLGREADHWREVWLTEEMRGWVAPDAVVALSGIRWAP